MKSHKMDDKLFEQLCEGLRQTAAIMNGEMEPAEVFHFDPIDVKALREELRQIRGDNLEAMRMLADGEV